MQFKIGDKAIYPSHGVIKIKNIEAKEVCGTPMNFYVLEIMSSGATLMVPTEASERAGMRTLITKEDIGKLFDTLKGSRNAVNEKWSRRFRKFSEKLRSGSAIEIAEVLKDLWSVQDTQELSYGEKKLMGKAYNLIASEISAASEQTIEETSKQIMR